MIYCYFTWQKGSLSYCNHLVSVCQSSIVSMSLVKNVTRIIYGRSLMKKIILSYINMTARTIIDSDWLIHFLGNCKVQVNFFETFRDWWLKDLLYTNLFKDDSSLKLLIEILGNFRGIIIWRPSSKYFPLMMSRWHTA